jgi:hypothetical protein
MEPSRQKRLTRGDSSSQGAEGVTTLVNRDVIVRDVNGKEIRGRCTAQSPAEYWIKVLLSDGTYLMAGADDFVRMADSPHEE